MKKETYSEKQTVRFKPSEIKAIEKVVGQKKEEFEKYKVIDYIRECTIKDLKKRGLLKA